MTTTSEKDNASPKLPVGITILGLTALSYAVAYVFQLSYLRFFGINYKLIEISPQSIVIAVIITIIMYYAVTSWLKSVFSISQTLDSSEAKILIAKYISAGSILTVIIFSFLAGIGVDLLSSLYWAMGIVISFIIATNVESIFWIIKRKSIKKGYSDFRNDVQAMYKREGDNYIDEYAEYVIIAVLLLALGMFSGRQFAALDSVHLPVIDSNTAYTQLLIQRSGNMIVTKNYDEQNHKLIDGYSISNIDGSKPISISRRINISER